MTLNIYYYNIICISVLIIFISSEIIALISGMNGGTKAFKWCNKIFQTVCQWDKKESFQKVFQLQKSLLECLSVGNKMYVRKSFKRE